MPLCVVHSTTEPCVCGVAVIPLNADAPPIAPNTHSSTISSTFAAVVTSQIQQFQPMQAIFNSPSAATINPSAAAASASHSPKPAASAASGPATATAGRMSYRPPSHPHTAHSHHHYSPAYNHAPPHSQPYSAPYYYVITSPTQTPTPTAAATTAAGDVAQSPQQYMYYQPIASPQPTLSYV